MNNKNIGKFSAKGYYIALILCAAAIGISGYLYYRNINQNDTQLQNPPADVTVGNPSNGDDLPVVSPGNNDSDGTINDAGDNSSDSKQVLQTCLPLEGEIIAEYAMECLSYNATTRDWRTHDGIDIAAEAGSEVFAAADGTVYNVYTDDTMGNTVVIRHQDGYVTVYASLSDDISVSVGDGVTMGQFIGTVGNTALLENAIGDHLHFAVTCNGEAVDPAEFFDLG